MVNKFTKENVIDLLYDKDNIKTDRDKIDCDADPDEQFFSITAPIFIPDYTRDLNLNFWVYLDYRIVEGRAVYVPFFSTEYKKDVVFTVAISDSCDSVEDMNESELEELIFKHLSLNDSFLDECKAFVEDYASSFTTD